MWGDYYRNWLTLWRLRSPTVCCLQAGESGQPWYIIHSEFNGLWIKEADGGSEPKTQKPGENGHPSSSKKPNSPFLFFFYSDPQQIGWHPPAWLRMLFLIQSTDRYWILSSVNLSGNTLTDTLGNSVSPAIWASLTRVKLTQKTNHLRVWVLIFSVASVFPVSSVVKIVCKLCKDWWFEYWLFQRKLKANTFIKT